MTSSVATPTRPCFNPRRPRGRRRKSRAYRRPSRRRFNPRRPRGRRHGVQTNTTDGILFQSTPPARAATRWAAPHGTHSRRFNPRRPRGRRRRAVAGVYLRWQFQSTPPARAATMVGSAMAPPRLFQSTPPARAATDRGVLEGGIDRVSIHAAREGGDATVADVGARVTAFQSTPPARAATPPARERSDSPAVSIHAAREGGDECPVGLPRLRHVSIHAAREGGDESSLMFLPPLVAFQSTPPARAATQISTS